MMRRIRVTPGLPVTGDVTQDCVVLTVIETIDLPFVDREAKEHDSVVDALEYLRNEPIVKSGDWDRIYIINATKEVGSAIQQQQSAP